MYKAVPKANIIMSITTMKLKIFSTVRRSSETYYAVPSNRRSQKTI